MQTIYDFVQEQEKNYLRPIDLNGWSWSMPGHIKNSFYYKHGRLLEGNSPSIPVKNITKPFLNLQYRAEDIDVKDVVLYVDNPDYYHLSFLIKKYHDDVFVVENDLDTFFDELKEQKIDYGGALCKRMNGARPEVVDLRSVAFCDQTDMLAGAVGIRHFYSPQELKKMEENGWGKKENGANITVDELLTLAEPKKIDDNQTRVATDTPTWYLELYEVYGTMPDSFVEENAEKNKFSFQMHVIGFYKDKKDPTKKIGVSLFGKKTKKSDLKFVNRDKIFGRALGYGGAEELFEPQAWTNHDVIRKKDLMDAAAKIVLQTTDTTVAQRHPSGLKNVDSLEIITTAEGTDLRQVDTLPRQMAIFDRSINEWYEYAQLMSGGTDALLGENPAAGTPFKTTNLITAQGKGLHEYRQGKFCKDIEWIYMNWILPEIVNKITEGTRFLSELTSDELKYVSDCVVRNKAKEFIFDRILKGDDVTEEEVEMYKKTVYNTFRENGNKRFIEILKGEFKGKPTRVKVNIKGKQKDLAKMTDGLTNIFRQIIASPDGFIKMMQIPEMAKNFNRILEYSGMSAADFGGMQYQKSPIQQEQLQEVTNQQIQ